MSRIQASIGAISWIDPTTGLPEVDAGHPGPMIPRGRFLAKAGYRFTHFLEAWIEVDTSARAIIGGNFSVDSGMYRGPSFLRTESDPVGAIGRKIIRTPQAVTFREVVGCRTMAPEKIGRTAGAVVGALAVPFLAPITGYIGYKGGRAVAEEAKVFPPIWSELELTINIDGSYTHKLLRHSLFPSVAYYAPFVPIPQMASMCLYALNYSYDAPPMLDQWYERGWGSAVAGGNTGRPGGAPTPGNPWAMTKPTFSTTSSVVSQPQGY